MADYTGSTTNLAFRDMTQTPLWLFDALNVEFGFQLDVAALPQSALCEKFLTPVIDALTVNWGDFMPARSFGTSTFSSEVQHEQAHAGTVGSTKWPHLPA